MRWILRARERAQLGASEPEAEDEYSRGARPSRAAAGALSARRPARSRAFEGALGLGLLAVLALVVAEFLPLLQVRSAQRATGIVASVQTGSHDSFALLPIALIALVFIGAAARAPAWPPLAALLVLGLIALGIALFGDLPDARATGLITLGSGSYVSAQASPAAGFFLETLGAILLIAGGGIGLLDRSSAARS